MRVDQQLARIRANIDILVNRGIPMANIEAFVKAVAVVSLTTQEGWSSDQSKECLEVLLKGVPNRVQALLWQCDDEAIVKLDERLEKKKQELAS